MADGVDALALGAQRALDLVAPEVPIAVPALRDVAFLEAGLFQHVLPVGDVHHLLLDGEGVVGLLVGLAVHQQGRRQRLRLNLVLDRRQHVGDVLELALEGPLPGGAEIIGGAEADIGRRAGLNGADRLGDAVLGGVKGEVDLDARRFLEFVDNSEQRIVLALVEAFGEPDRHRLLGERRSGPAGGDGDQGCAGSQRAHGFHGNLPFQTFKLSFFVRSS